MNLSLFDDAPSFDKQALALKLSELARENIFLGGSSWKYPGWIGQIYTRERYLSRGKFSQKCFEAECLSEYAETFPIVCGDFSFYQFPAPEFWEKLLGSVGPLPYGRGSVSGAVQHPERESLCEKWASDPAVTGGAGRAIHANQRHDEALPVTAGSSRGSFTQTREGGDENRLKFALKVPEEVTVEAFPKHPRYGPRAGEKNVAYLNVDAFRTLFLEPLEPYRGRVACLIFEFGARGTDADEFLKDIAPFFDALPTTFRYAVEVRNREYLIAPYFDLLREHRLAHVLNGWTKMPPLEAQIEIPEAFTTDFTVARALLREGRPYATAVEQFAPYNRIQDENPEGRQALRDLIKRMREERRATYIFVNNRFEGNSPETIRAIVDEAAD